MHLVGVEMHFDLVERLCQDFDRLQIDGKVEVALRRLEYQNAEVSSSTSMPVPMPIGIYGGLSGMAFLLHR